MLGMPVVLSMSWLLQHSLPPGRVASPRLVEIVARHTQYLQKTISNAMHLPSTLHAPHASQCLEGSVG